MSIETKKRSIAKALSWRVVATTTTMLIVWFFTGEAALSAGIGLADVFIKLAAYYWHERAWGKLSYGLVQAGKNKGMQGEGI